MHYGLTHIKLLVATNRKNGPTIYLIKDGPIKMDNHIFKGKIFSLEEK